MVCDLHCAACLSPIRCRGVAMLRFHTGPKSFIAANSSAQCIDATSGLLNGWGFQDCGRVRLKAASPPAPVRDIGQPGFVVQLSSDTTSPFYNASVPAPSGPDLVVGMTGTMFLGSKHRWMLHITLSDSNTGGFVKHFGIATSGIATSSNEPKNVSCWMVPTSGSIVAIHLGPLQPPGYTTRHSYFCLLDRTAHTMRAYYDGVEVGLRSDVNAVKDPTVVNATVRLGDTGVDMDVTSFTLSEFLMTAAEVQQAHSAAKAAETYPPPPRAISLASCLISFSFRFRLRPSTAPSLSRNFALLAA